MVIFIFSPKWGVDDLDPRSYGYNLPWIEVEAGNPHKGTPPIKINRRFITAGFPLWLTFMGNQLKSKCTDGKNAAQL